MTYAMRLKDERKIGVREGIEQGKLEAAMAMLKNGIPMDMVIKCTQLPEETVEKIAKEHGLRF